MHLVRSAKGTTFIDEQHLVCPLFSYRCVALTRRVVCAESVLWLQLLFEHTSDVLRVEWTRGET